MGILLLRDSTAATTSSNSDDVGKNVGIVLGCLAVLAVLLPIISRSCGCFGRRPPTELPVHSISPASRRRHLNAAEIMRLCAIRDSTRPLPAKPKKRSLLSVSEVDLAAPKLSYGDLLAREPAVETVTVPPRALIREDATQSAANTETPGSTGAEKKSLTAIDSVEQGDHAVCSICLEDFEDADSVRETICHHVFHSCCLEQWLTKRRSHCPLCQGDLKLKREEC